MRAKLTLIALAALLLAPPAFAYDANDPANCVGVEWDDVRPLVMAQVTARPRVNFVKSPYDDDFKADACPAASPACRRKSYLVTGDLVLAARTRGEFTCVSFPSLPGKRPIWSNGWLPTSALKPLAPTAEPARSDWLGNWDQPYAGIEIREGGLGGRLRIEGIAAVKGAREVHTGAINAEVMPDKDSITFLEDGWLPSETKCDSGCRVRMHRVGPWLLVEDNGDCGGAGVTFNGIYRRK